MKVNYLKEDSSQIHFHWKQITFISSGDKLLVQDVKQVPSSSERPPARAHTHTEKLTQLNYAFYQ